MAPPSADEDLARLRSSLGWRALEAYRRVVCGSAVLSSVHALITAPARRLMPARTPTTQDRELQVVQGTLGWRLLHSLAARSRSGRVGGPAAAEGAPASSGRRIMSGSESPWGRGGWRAGTRNEAHRYLKYPLYLPSPPLTLRERLTVKLHWGVVKCTVC